MNYRQEQELKKKKRRKIGLILFGVACIIGIFVGIFCKFYPADGWKYYLHQPNVSARKGGELRVHFLDVGQGDCTIIEFPDGKTMIIDGGDGKPDTAKTILRYTNALKIKTFDYMLLTHADSDHSGSLDEVLRLKGAKMVYCPKLNDYTVNSEYAEFCMELEKSSAEKVYSEVGVFQAVQGRYPYRFAILSPHKIGNPDCEYNAVNDGNYSDTDMNDTSAVLLVEYQGKRILFCGDAGTDVENSLMLSDRFDVWRTGELSDLYLKADVLKVSHHGSDTATGAEFLQYIEAKYAVISCGKDNAYGHPHADVVQRLQEANVEIYRTDKTGTMICTIDDGGICRMDS